MMREITEAEFQAEVLNQNGRVLVDFFTPTCPPCRMMLPIVQELAQEKAGSLKVVKVDASVAMDVASQFGVMNVPTFLIFKDGQVIAQRLGQCSKRAFAEWVDDAK
jgi:thioredoxin 1